MSPPWQMSASLRLSILLSQVQCHSPESRTSDTSKLTGCCSKTLNKMVDDKGTQGQVSILPHSNASWGSDSQKLLLHWRGPSSQLWLFLFPHPLNRIPVLVNRVPWTHYKATVLKIPVYFEANISNWISQILSEISQTEKDKYCMLSLICGI